MLFSVGTRVKFLHSKDEGVVTALLDGEMVNVLLDDSDLEIPVFIDDLIRSEDYFDQHPSVKAKIIPGKQPKVPAKPDRPAAETQYTILKSAGIQLAFDPVLNANAHAEKYRIFLINDTPYEVLFSASLELRGRAAVKYNGKLAGVSYQEVGELFFDQLNDAPSFNLECWRVTTEGTGSRLQRRLRIRPKQFFSRIATAPLLNRQVHLFRIFRDLNKSNLEGREEDLRTYTKKNLKPLAHWPNIKERYPHEVLELAEFIPELDLHIDKLVADPEQLNKAEILQVQVRHFEQYLQQAIRLGVSRVFIIHGLGKGKLRQLIAKNLRQYPEVTSFKNEYHPRYGWGATEVELMSDY